MQRNELCESVCSCELLGEEDTENTILWNRCFRSSVGASRCILCALCRHVHLGSSINCSEYSRVRVQRASDLDCYGNHNEPTGDIVGDGSRLVSLNPHIFELEKYVLF